MNQRRFECAALTCLAVDRLPADQRPEALAIFCHGYGAPATDLVPLAEELLALEPALATRVRFLFPAAPLSLDDRGLFGGRAWWPIEVDGLADRVAAGELRRARSESAPQVVEASRKVADLALDQASAENLPISRVVFGGFSQGAMVATHAALELPVAAGGLCIYSGALLCEAQWRQRALQHTGMEVLQSHGRSDPLLPFEAALWLRDMFVEAGLSVDFIPFGGGHWIPPDALRHTADMLRRVAK